MYLADLSRRREESMPAAKSAELSWGQRYIWLKYQMLPPEARHDTHIVSHHELPESISPAGLQAVLDYLVRRHESMRTVYDPVASPWPQQTVLPPSRVAIHWATTERDGTPAPADVVMDLTATPFDMTSELPFRVAVITTGGAPRRLVTVFSHVTFDNRSLELFRREFQEVLTALTARRPAGLPPVLHQPVDLARHESGLAPPTRATAMEYWREELAQTPADMFARRRAGADGPVQGDTKAISASLTSPSLTALVHDIARRHRVWPSVVHLAAYAVTMAAYCGEPVVTAQRFVSQREPSGHPTVLSCMFSPSTVSVDTSGDPLFSEVLRRAAERTEAARPHTYVPYDVIVELSAAESSRRGQLLRSASLTHTASEINFLTDPGRCCGVRRPCFTWNPEPKAWARSGSDTYFRCHEWQDGTTLTLRALTTVMDAAAVRRFIEGYIEVLESHRDATVDLPAGELARGIGFPTAGRRGLLRVGTDLVDGAATEDVIATHPAVVSARVEVDGAVLAAEVRTRDRVDVPALRAHVLGALEDRPGVRCPERFTVFEETGVVLRKPEAPSRAERDLTDAVARVNGIGSIDPWESYVTAGGRVMRIPRVLRELRDAGWDGLSIGDLSGPRPLKSCAERMVAV